MHKFLARLFDGAPSLNLLALALAVFVTLGYASTAQAQSNPGVIISKFQCTDALAPTPASISIMSPSCATPPGDITTTTNVHYVLVVQNPLGASETITVTEDYPTGFTVSAIKCDVTAGPSSPLTPPLTSLPSQLTLAVGDALVCIITGKFTIANTGLQNMATVTNANGGSMSATLNSTVIPLATLPTDLSITKTASPAVIDVQSGSTTDTISYTITIENNGGDINLDGIFELHDRLKRSTTSVQFIATLVQNSVTCTVSWSSGPDDCPDEVQVNNSPLTLSTALQSFIEWGYPAGEGVFPNGGTITLTYDVNITPVTVAGPACVLNGDSIQNSAFFSFNTLGATSTINDQNSNNNTASSGSVNVETGQILIDPVLCDSGGTSGVVMPPSTSWPIGPEKLELEKEIIGQSSTPLPWGGYVDYKVKVMNISSVDINNIHVFDRIVGGPTMPPFTATVIPNPLLVGCGSWGAACAPPFAVISPQTNLGGGNAVIILDNWNTMIQTLPAGAEQILYFRVMFSDPSCNSSPNVTPKIIHNAIYASYDEHDLDPNDGTPLSTVYRRTVSPASVFTEMEDPEPCLLQITKTSNATKVQIDVPFQYTVTFKNTDIGPRIFGTLFDAARIVPFNYTTYLPVEYDYQCTPTTSGGNPTVTGGVPTPGSQIVKNVVNVQTPHKGVRLFENTSPVTFEAGGELVCNITIKIGKPYHNDNYCLSNTSAQLENLALMDSSDFKFYNSNTPWPPSSTYNNALPLEATQPPAGVPNNWATAAVTLPKCFNLEINKSPQPKWTWDDAGNTLVYTLTITNHGEDIDLVNNPSSTALYVEDFISPPFGTSSNMSLSSDPCVGANAPCTWITPPNWNTPQPANPFKLRIDKLDAGDTLELKFELPGPFPLGQNGESIIINDAMVYMDGPDSGDWYSPGESCDGVQVPGVTGACSKAEVPIFEVNDLKVTKAIQSETNLPPPATSFFIDVSCGSPPYNVSDDFHVNNGEYQLIEDIPVSSICTVSETPPQNINVGTIACPGSGTASWTASFSPSQAVEIPSPPTLMTVDVLNILTCDPPPPPPEIIINKELIGCATSVPFECTFNVEFTNNGPGTFYGAILFEDEEVLGAGTFVPSSTSGLGCISLNTSSNSIMCIDSGVMPWEPLADGDSRNYQLTYSFASAQAANEHRNCARFRPGSERAGFHALTQQLIALGHLDETNPSGESLSTLLDAAILAFQTDQGITPNPAILDPMTAEELFYSGFNIWGLTQPPDTQGEDCVDVNIPLGSLEITKSAVSTTGGATTPTSTQFPFVVDCGQSLQPNPSFNLAANGSHAISYIPNNTQCTVTETLPTQPISEPACANGMAIWTSAATSQTATISATSSPFVMNFENTYQCAPPGSIEIIKTVTPPTSGGLQPPNTAFTFTVSNCGSNIPPFILADGGSHIISDIPFNTQCTVTETLPQQLYSEFSCPPPHAASWTSTAPSQTVTVQSASSPTIVTFENTYQCAPIPPHNTFVITKTVTLAPGQQPSATQFDFTVSNCGSILSNTQPFTLAGNGSHTILYIPDGDQCTVTETLPTQPVSEPACASGMATWTSLTPSQTVDVLVSSSSTYLNFVNTYQCEPATTGALEVTKTFGGPISSTVQFPINVTCTLSNGQNHPVQSPLTFTGGANSTQTINNIPVGTNCQVSEDSQTLPNLSFCPNGTNWSVTYPDGEDIEIQSGSQSLEVHNESSCKPIIIFIDDLTALPANTDFQGFVAGPGNCEAGETCRFEAAIKNVGKAAYKGPLSIRSEVNIPGAKVSTASGEWSCSRSGNNWNCAHPSLSLAPGASLTLPLDVRLPGNAKAGGKFSLCAERAEPEPGNAPVRFVQTVLTALGLDVGPIDNAMGKKTRVGIEAFRRAVGLPVTSEIDDALIEALRARVAADANPDNDKDCQAVAVISKKQKAPGSPGLKSIQDRLRDAIRSREALKSGRSRTKTPKAPSIDKGGDMRDKVRDKTRQRLRDAKPKAVDQTSTPPKCDPRSTVLKDNRCVCRYPGMKQVSKTSCGK